MVENNSASRSCKRFFNSVENEKKDCDISSLDMSTILRCDSSEIRLLCSRLFPASLTMNCIV